MKRATTKDIAAKTGLSLNSVYKHIATSGVKADKNKTYDAEKVVAHIKDRQSKDNKVVHSSSLKEAQAAVKLQMMKLDLDERQGKVVSRDEVSRKFSEIGIAIKMKMLAIPNAVAGRLEGLQAADIAEILKVEIEHALTELADQA